MLSKIHLLLYFCFQTQFWKLARNRLTIGENSYAAPFILVCVIFLFTENSIYLMTVPLCCCSWGTSSKYR